MADTERLIAEEHPEGGDGVAGVHSPLQTLKENDLFLICDSLGNIPGHSRESGVGLFCADTRYLSHLELLLNGQPPVLLSGTADAGFAATMLLTNAQEQGLPEDSIGLSRNIVLCGALFENLEVTNYSRDTVSLKLSLCFSADFADLFEVRGWVRPERGTRLKSAVPSQEQIVLAYRGLDQNVVETRISFDLFPPERIERNTAHWSFSLATHQSIRLAYRVNLFRDGGPVSFTLPPATFEQAKATLVAAQQAWRNDSTRISSNNELFEKVIERSARDLFLLHFSMPEGRSVSAGVPWFATLFGRDALISASQTLMIDPVIARETLKLLAHFQGQEDNEWRDEQPGKILHELRRGEMARCREVPHTPYYGTIDATPLWLMLLAEYYSWTADLSLVRSLWPNTLAAMGWIDRNLREQPEILKGYLAYDRRSSRGLANQGWKDSNDCIVHTDGSLAEGPIALCEVQGYVFAAKVRLSGLAHLLGETQLAQRWLEEALLLRERFNEEFWLSDQDYCAMALDGHGKQVAGIGSNPGQCLCTGILTREHAHAVAERLTAPDLFSGWGVRTLHSTSPAFNPIGYHTGSVWPHDNALIALGLRSTGHPAQMIDIGSVLFEVAQNQPYYRLPELFCGFARTEGNPLVSYPVACSPQAWAAGSPFQILQAFVNLVPDAPTNCLRVIDPVLPDWLGQVAFKNLRVGASILDLEFEREGDSTTCRVTNKRGNIRVIIET